MILLNGTPITASEVWVCACSSGGCTTGNISPKCYRKGGEYVTDVRHAETGELIATEMYEDEGRRMVREWGWKDMGGGLYRSPSSPV